MATQDPEFHVVDTLVLRFDGTHSDGTVLHELRAAHVAEVLQGVVGLASDFIKAGVFDPEGSTASEILVRPAKQGSFMLEVLRVVTENPEAAAALGVPSLGQLIWWSTKSVRAGVEDFEHLPDNKVKVKWQDGEAREIPKNVWNELQKRKNPRKRHLTSLMAPLSDPRVESLELPVEEPAEPDESPQTIRLTRDDYLAVRPSDDAEENSRIFEAEAQMSAIDFDNPAQWRVKTLEGKRRATVEDEDFLGRVAASLAIRKSDIFYLRIREDQILRDGKRPKTTWTVLEVISHRRASVDDGD